MSTSRGQTCLWPAPSFAAEAASPASLRPRGPGTAPAAEAGTVGCPPSECERRGGWPRSQRRVSPGAAGVLLELGFAKEQATEQRAEQHVLKLDAEAQARFRSFLRDAFQNPHTLFVLVHDHAHWDLARLVRRGGHGPPLG